MSSANSVSKKSPQGAYKAVRKTNIVQMSLEIYNYSENHYSYEKPFVKFYKGKNLQRGSMER